MQILILGASSNVGAALAQAFAPNNAVFLVGRNAERLKITASACRVAGALQARPVEVDFTLGLAPLLQALAGQQIDLIIDAASASSGIRDLETKTSDLGAIVKADFSAKVALFDHILQKQESAPAVIYISTVLTLVKSPGRTVYTSLKQLYEVYLRKLQQERRVFQLLVVYVGTVIDTKGASGKPAKLAAVVRRAYGEKREKLFYGLSGRLFLTLFYCQPVLFFWFTHAQRRVRSLFARRLS